MIYNKIDYILTILFIVGIFVGILNLFLMGSIMSEQQKKKFCMKSNNYELCMERLKDE